MCSKYHFFGTSGRPAFQLGLFLFCPGTRGANFFWYWTRLRARPLGFLFLSCLATLGVCFLTLHHCQNSQGITNRYWNIRNSHRILFLTQIQDLKNEIHAKKGIEADSQKIVFKGKATNNPDVLEAIGVKENDFLVVMTLVKKPVKEVKEPPKK